MTQSLRDPSGSVWLVGDTDREFSQFRGADVLRESAISEIRALKSFKILLKLLNFEILG